VSSNPSAVDETDEIDELGYLRAVADRSGVSVPRFVAPTEHSIELGGMQFHYLDWGEAGRPPALFLHGGGLNAHTWDIVCLALRERFQCLALDQRGHGDSQWSEALDYSTDAHLRDVTGFVDALGLSRFLLVGMSMGASNALAFAARHSDRLAGLVLIDIQPAIRTDGRQRIQDFVTAPTELASLDDFIERAMQFNPRRDRRLLRFSLLRNLRQQPDGNWTWKYDRRHRVQGSSPERQAREAAARSALWTSAAEIACPTLYVRGADSDVTWREEMERVAAGLPRWQFVEVENAGHTVQGDNPKGLLRELDTFATRLGL
jgi:esterase